MSRQPVPSPDAYRRLAILCAAFAALMAATVLVGWHFDIVAFKRAHPALTVTNPTVACALLLAAGSLAALVAAGARGRQLGRLGGSLVALIAVSRLSDLYLGTAWNWDRLLFTEKLLHEIPPDHMAPATAWALVALGFALVGIGSRRPRLLAAGQWGALACGLLAFGTLIAYTNRAIALIDPLSHPMALQAALALFALALGVLCARSHEGIMRAVSSAGPGGTTLRRLLPAFLLLPLVLSLTLRLSPQATGATGLVAVEFEFSLLALVLIVWHARSLDQANAAIQRASASADEREHEVALLLAQIDASPDGIIVIDDQWRLVALNRRYRELFPLPADLVPRPGMSAEPLLESVLDLCVDPAAQRAAIEAAYRQTEHDVCDEATLTDGRTFERIARTVRLPDGTVFARLWTLRDITERKRLEGELRARYEQLRELDRLKGNFVSAVSHDLRTPLTTIRGFAELLSDGVAGALNASQHEFVDQIERGTARLEHLVDDLLDFARLEAGTFKLRPDEADLADKVREIASSLRLMAEESGVTLELDLPDEPLHGRFDALRLGQVLTNLLHNALKATPAGGRVRLEAWRDDGQLHCAIRDTGPGIAEADRPKLFQRFSQLGSFTEKGGTGLGLSISKAIVEAHGGHIELVETTAPGATFHFAVPVAGPPGP